MEPYDSRNAQGTFDSESKRASHVPSCVSVKTDWSMEQPIRFSTGVVSPIRQHSIETAVQTNVHMEGTKNIKQDSYTAVDDVLHRVIEKHKKCMKIKCESLFEGIKAQENKIPLNRIYTQLYIIEGESDGMNEEHEVLVMEKSPSKQSFQDTQINCVDIFKPDKLPTFQKIRIVMTKGIAGIGKTVSVQKFILDWAEENVNQDVDFIFVLPFRELNLIKDDNLSFHRLLCDFHPEIKDLDAKIYDVCKVMLIFDGLDESRIPLTFSECEKVSDITMTSSMGVLMANLIKGELLPSALIWLTSRPAAATQIPPQYINRLTEIQGFTDPQKEEYFRKKISDKHQAEKIISHIKAARSLHIMCHIPVFCWISATVLQKIIQYGNEAEVPKSLTEMYSHYLCTQTSVKSEKYEETEVTNTQTLLQSSRQILLKLAELAFKQLIKGKLVFYEEDLRECSIDVTEASVYSGICTEIFREESVLYQRKVYCFVHLSFQEFLAALYVFHCYVTKKMEDLKFFLNDNIPPTNFPLEELLKGTVEKALESQYGNLDIFLRFLLGMSLESNQRLLQGLLTETIETSQSITETVQHIKHIIKTEDVPAEGSVNLFLCLTEMKDQSLSMEVQKYFKSDKHSEIKLSAAHCSAIAYMLQMPGEVLEELDLKKFNTSEEGYRRLIPAVSSCRKALLSGCNITPNLCETLTSAMQCANATLKELDLSNNSLHDSGLNQLFGGLKSAQGKLEILRLAGCNLTLSSCDILASSLEFSNSHLKELDLSNNDIQDPGVKLLCAGLKNSHCKLNILRVAICNLGEKTCENLASLFYCKNYLKELDLSNNDLQDSGVKLLSIGLKNSNCKLEILRLSGCLVTEEGCFSLASVLSASSSHLKELDLTYNHPGDSGVKVLRARLQDPRCILETLKVENGGRVMIKRGLRKYACELTLDPNTANKHLCLSDGNRTVMRVWKEQSYPDHPERFDVWEQVLCRESLSGRCYWECEWSGDEAAIAVTYKGIRRKGDSDDCGFGYNEKSWWMNCFNNKYHVTNYCAWHNKKRTNIPVPASGSNRVGVYLDWPTGTLSFYSVSSDTHALTHIYTLQAKFTEPLYAGFGFEFGCLTSGSSVCVCHVD